MKYKQGDILENKDRNRRKVLGICGEVYFISISNGSFSGDHLDEYGSGWTQKDLDFDGYSLRKPKPETMEISGKKYLKEDVEKRVKKLKPLEE